MDFVTRQEIRQAYSRTWGNLCTYWTGTHSNLTSKAGTSIFSALFPAMHWSKVAYSGSHGVHLMGILERDQLAPQYLSLGNQLNSQVANPFYGAITQGQLATPTITLGQSLLPYPQFLGVSSRNANYGDSSYNALLVRAERRLSKGFSLAIAYTFSKEIDDVVPSVNGFPGESFSGGGLQNYYDLHQERPYRRGILPKHW